MISVMKAPYGSSLINMSDLTPNLSLFLYYGGKKPLG